MKKVFVITVFILIFCAFGIQPVRAFDSGLTMGFVISGESSEIKTPVSVPVFLRLFMPPENIYAKESLASTGTHVPENPQVFQGLPFELSTGAVAIKNLLGMDLTFAGLDKSPEKIDEKEWLPMEYMGGRMFKYSGNISQFPWGPELLQARAKVKDNYNRIRFLFFTITIMKEGHVYGAYILNVQNKPTDLDWKEGTRQEFFQYLRGFIFADAEPANPQLIEKMNAERLVKKKEAARPKILRFEACPQKVAYNGETTVYWEVDDKAGMVYVNGVCVPRKSQSTIKNLTQSGKVSIKAVNLQYEDVPAEREISIEVEPKPAPSPAASPSPTATPEPPKVVKPEVTIMIDPSAVEEGGTGVVTWESNSSVSKLFLNGKEVKLKDRITYENMVCDQELNFQIYGGGEPITKNETIKVTPKPQPKIPAPTFQYITVDSAEIVAGKKTTIRWQTYHATKVRIFGVDRDPCGFLETNNLNETTTILVEAFGPGGRATGTVTITVKPIPAAEAPPPPERQTTGTVVVRTYSSKCLNYPISATNVRLITLDGRELCQSFDTSANGEYTVPNVPVGTFIIDADGDWMNKVAKSGKSPWTLRKGQTITIFLYRKY